MKIFGILLSCILLIDIVIACSSKSYYVEEEANCELVMLDSSLSCENLAVKDLIDSVRIIKLETTEESVISFVEDIVTTSDYIYVLDDYRSGDVAIFDSAGRFLKRLPIGNGPGEINLPQSISFDYARNELLVDIPNRINKYTPDGTFICSYDKPYSLSRIIPTENGYLVLQSEHQNPQHDFAVFETDTSFNIQHTYYMTGKACAIYADYYVRRDNGDILIYRPLIDDIYKYSNGDVAIYRKLVYPKNKANTSVLDWADAYSLRELSKQKDKSVFWSYHETQNYEYYRFRKGGNPGFDIFRNKKNGKIFSEYEPENIYSIDQVGIRFGTYENFFINLFDAGLANYLYEQRDSIIEVNKDILSEESIKKISEMKEDDNPLFILFSLKDV